MALQAAYERYTEVFLEELAKINPFRLKQAILNNEDIDDLLLPHLDEIRDEARTITWIPGVTILIKQATKKKTIRKYLENELWKLPEHYQVCRDTPNGMDYLAVQVRKIILIAIGES